MASLFPEVRFLPVIRYGCVAFSSAEAAFLLVSTKNPLACPDFRSMRKVLLSNSELIRFVRWTGTARDLWVREWLRSNIVYLSF